LGPISSVKIETMAKTLAGVNIVTLSPPPALAGCWPVQVAPTIAVQGGELPSTAFDVPILLAEAELDPTLHRSDSHPGTGLAWCGQMSGATASEGPQPHFRALRHQHRDKTLSNAMMEFVTSTDWYNDLLPRASRLGWRGDAGLIMRLPCAHQAVTLGHPPEAGTLVPPVQARETPLPPPHDTLRLLETFYLLSQCYQTQ